ncbi:MtrAB system histidine kinase MtrB [Naumannella halotolerans]|uniref:MtrAB system histidine kinase MtrB n=1 Tax=Naumannella halotolerans TaxID=993414 RepID=UPI00370D61CD
MSPTSRIAQWARFPLRWWWGSLPLRVISSVLIASVGVTALSGVLLMRQAADGVLEGKRQSATVVASVAFDTAQRQLTAADIDRADISTLLVQLTLDASNRGSGATSYDVVVDGPYSAFSSPGVRTESVPESLRQQVATDNGIWITYTTLLHDDGRPDAPGLVVGTSLVDPGSGRYPMYVLFPLEQEQQTLDVLQQAVITSGVLLSVLLALIAALVARQVVAPIREARKTAELLASGLLDNRLPVRGTDDLASLASSMNNMASELQKQISQLEDLSVIQQQFVSDVSHELRTPLTTVRMAAEVLYEERDSFDPMVRRSAELLQKELDRFEEMLTDLLEISRFDAGEAELSLSEVDLAVLVGNEIAAQRAFAGRLGTELRLHTGPDVVAEVDERRIRRVLRNLITNAIEHGEGKPIDIEVAGDEKAVAVTVRDHGVGFEAGQVRLVFHRFWRADPSRDRTIGGSGLGLSISMEDVRLHGGWLNAWGRPGLGAQFRMTLPRTQDTILQLSPLPLMPRDAVAEPHRRPAQGSASATGHRTDGDATAGGGTAVKAADGRADDREGER